MGVLVSKARGRGLMGTSGVKRTQVSGEGKKGPKRTVLNTTQPNRPVFTRGTSGRK